MRSATYCISPVPSLLFRLPHSVFPSFLRIYNIYCNLLLTWYYVPGRHCLLPTRCLPVSYSPLPLPTSPFLLSLLHTHAAYCHLSIAYRIPCTTTRYLPTAIVLPIDSSISPPPSALLPPRLSFANCPLPIAQCLLPIDHCLLPIAHQVLLKDLLPPSPLLPY